MCMAVFPGLEAWALVSALNRPETFQQRVVEGGDVCNASMCIYIGHILLLCNIQVFWAPEPASRA